AISSAPDAAPTDESPDRSPTRPSVPNNIGEKSRRRHMARFRDRADQQIWTVPNVGETAEKGCRHRNGGQAAPMAGRKLCDIGKMIDVEMIDTKGSGKEGQISGCIIEHAGKQTGAPIKTSITGEVEISRVEF